MFIVELFRVFSLSRSRRNETRLQMRLVAESKGDDIGWHGREMSTF